MAALLRGRGVGLDEQLLELTAGVHLHHDIAAADELAIDVQLRDGGPVAAGRRQLHAGDGCKLGGWRLTRIS